MDPFTIALIALMAGSTGANIKGQRTVDSNRAAALQRGREHREKREKEAIDAFEQTKSKYADTEENLAETEADLASALKGSQEPISQGPTLLTPFAEGSPEVVNEVSRQRGNARDFTNRLADNRARLDAVGEVMLDNALELNSRGFDINRANTAARNYTQNVLPLDLEQANLSGRNWFTLADIMQMGAQLVGPKALGKNSTVKPDWAGTTDLGKLPRGRTFRVGGGL